MNESGAGRDYPVCSLFALAAKESRSKVDDAVSNLDTQLVAHGLASGAV